MVWSRISGSLILSLYGLLSLSACSSDKAPRSSLNRQLSALPPPTSPATTPGAWYPATWTQLSHDDGRSNADLTSQSWSIGDIALSSANLVEATRFDIDRPARIVGVSVQYGALPSRTLAADARSTPRLWTQRL